MFKVLEKTTILKTYFIPHDLLSQNDRTTEHPYLQTKKTIKMTIGCLKL
tara:strand:+ start:77 stop:223 length:147 start_codon:yes stop_codon:yes gene_type:complete